MTGRFWDFIATVGDDSQFLGIGLVIAFIAGWGLAAGLYYGGGYHLVELKQSPLVMVDGSSSGGLPLVHDGVVVDGSGSSGSGGSSSGEEVSSSVAVDVVQEVERRGEKSLV